MNERNKTLDKKENYRKSAQEGKERNDSRLATPLLDVSV
jgi:hypothetical protein